MTHSARNDPTPVNDQSRSVARKTGTATTNQMSRAPNRKSLAAERTLTSLVFEKSPLNFGFFFDFPMTLGSDSADPRRITSNAPAMPHPCDRNR